MLMDTRERLRGLVCELAFMEGDFTLASGRRSQFYIDGKRVVFHPEGLLLVADAFLEAIQGCECDAIGGLAMGAVPIAAGISLRSAQLGRPLPAFFVRKSAKGHGTNRVVEGCLDRGSRVVICDDVITTGGSALEAIEAVKEFGCTVARIISLVDREEGAIERFRDLRYDYHPIFTLTEVRQHARTHGTPSAAH